MYNLEDMNKCLETYNLLRLNQEETVNLKRPTTSKEIKAVIKKLRIYKSPGSDGSTGKFYQIFKEELVSTFPKLFQNTEEKIILLNSFCEASITNTKTRQRHYKEENYRPIS